MNRLLAVGGGSAGHVLPAVPVMQALLARGWQVTFVGTHSGLEARLLADLPITFKAIQAGKLRRYWSWQNVTDVFRIAIALVQSCWLLARLRPNVVFSKGGFVSVPVVVAAWLLRIPVVAHESDLTPGLANRLVARFLRTLCVSFAETRAPRAAQVLHTGTPIRAEMLNGDAARGRAALGLSNADSQKPLLLVTGGSLGADELNRVVRAAAPELVQQYDVLHVCGAGKTEPLALPGYQQLEYVGAGWGDLLAAADLVVSRAGANALFELLALGKLSLLVPLPAAQSRGDQIDNAAFAERAGLAHVVDEAELDPTTLQAALQRLREARPTLAAALAAWPKPDAVSAIVGALEQAGHP